MPTPGQEGVYVHGQVGVEVGCRWQGKRTKMKDFPELNEKEEGRRSRERACDVQGQSHLSPSL